MFFEEQSRRRLTGLNMNVRKLVLVTYDDVLELS